MSSNHPNNTAWGGPNRQGNNGFGSAAGGTSLFRPSTPKEQQIHLNTYGRDTNININSNISSVHESPELSPTTLPRGVAVAVPQLQMRPLALAPNQVNDRSDLGDLTDRRMKESGSQSLRNRRDIVASNLQASFSLGDRIPSLQHNPLPTIPSPAPYIAPWGTGAPLQANTNTNSNTVGAFGTTFYNESSDNLSITSSFSPGFRPGSSRQGGVVIDDPGIDYFQNELEHQTLDFDLRRPSVASVTTQSSVGSRSEQTQTNNQSHHAYQVRNSRSQTSKLATFFGEDDLGGVSGGSSSTANAHSGSNKDRSDTYSKSSSHSRTRKGSFNPLNLRGREGSTSSQRSTTPVPNDPAPSSDVTPFLFQDPEDIQLYGDAPVRNSLSGPDRTRYVTETLPPRPATSGRSAASKLHLPHRHNKSVDNQNKAGTPLRPGISRGASTVSISRVTTSDRNSSSSGPASKFSTTRSKSPSTSVNSSQTGNTSINGREHPKPEHSKARAVMSLFRSKKPRDDQHVSNLKPLPQVPRGPVERTMSAHGESSDASPYKMSHIAQMAQDNPFGSEIAGVDGAASSSNGQSHRAPFGGFRNLTTFPKRKHKTSKPNDEYDSIDPRERAPSLPPSNTAGGELDMNAILDIKDMQGIISGNPQPTPLDNPIFSGQDPEQVDRNAAGPGAPNWNAPESWAVKGLVEENLGRLPEIDEDIGDDNKIDDNAVPYCIRLFKTDGTFSTLSMPLQANVTEIINQLSRKIHSNDSGANYQIVMRKHAQQRILSHAERPVNIQRKLLKQAGYEDKDRIEDVGREDNSYLCRFSFIPARESGYAQQWPDSGFGKMVKFSHIDLSGRNLITIPIALYSKASDIVSLNLSRNLSLDVPMDFIQSCLNLRELKFTNNEAWALPKSLTAASRLSILDISNNRLEQLDHIDLKRLTMLMSMKASNNCMRVLPEYFGSFRHLRILNVSSNFLEKFPSFLCKLTGLVDLDMSFNAISAIPKDIGKLQNLERFAITNNRLKGLLPPEVGELTSLREIDIRYNGLTSIDILASLPLLENLSADHNAVTKFEGTFNRMTNLRLNSNPVTRFEITNTVYTLTQLVLSNAKLASLPDAIYEKMPNLTKLVLDNNHLVSLSSQIGKLRSLEYLSIAVNALSTLPAEIGSLQNLVILDVRQNNLNTLPAEIWWACRLESLNVSSNVMNSFPRHNPKIPPPLADASPSPSPGAEKALPQPPDMQIDTVGPLSGIHAGRRPSTVGGNMLGNGSVPSSMGVDRKASTVSAYGRSGRKTSIVSTARNASQSTVGTMTPPPISRKDSNVSTRMANTLAGSLKALYLADNGLDDDVFDELTHLAELRVLNLSYNNLQEIPPRALRAFPQLIELYLSGNDLTSLPSDDFQSHNTLQVLYLNGNNLQTLPAELGNAKGLTVLDSASNYLKYNVSNLNYDWNWNYNPALKYLNLSGNKRLEIKPAPAYQQNGVVREQRNLTDFSNLHHLRVLGLMDVTLTIPTVPDETEDRRVRTSGSTAGSLAYGMADSLGRNDQHLSIIDMVVPRFNGQESETLLGLFDGESLPTGGSRIAKYLHENFGPTFVQALQAVRETKDETIEDALRRSFLSLNKDLAIAATLHTEDRSMRTPQRGSSAKAVLSNDDLYSGGVATVMFLTNMELYIANVGNAQAIILHNDGTHHILTKKHDPADPFERERIRDAGGWVSRTGKLNDSLNVSRAFGYVQLMPAVQAAPHIMHYTLKETDDMIIVASSELWEYVPVPLIVDIARSCNDLMATAQKLRDFAIAFGSTAKIMVMCLSVADLKKRANRTNKTSMYLGPAGMSEEGYLPAKRPRRKGDNSVEDSGLRRLEAEVAAPVGDINIVFTDIKGSTMLWDTLPEAMRTALRLHNDVMRRYLRLIGGYEVKTEGDAFIASFPTATSALIWCFTCQSALLEVAWPSEILEHSTGQDVYDSNGNLIYRGVSVRMGIHFGTPVCEVDPVTKRMDYFGPMVNKAARISATADGGQISVSQDFIMEIQRCLHTYSEEDRSNSTASDTSQEDVLADNIRKELRQLSTQGFEVKDMGERKLKGLENPEFIFLVYPHILAGRIEVNPRLGIDAKDEPIPVPETKERQKAVQPMLGRTNEIDDSEYGITTDMIWNLWGLSLRLEMLCTKLEIKDGELLTPEFGLMERMKADCGDVGQQFMLNFFRHLTVRIESTIAIIAMRDILLTSRRLSDPPDVSPPQPENFLDSISSPLDMILQQMKDEQEELRAYRERFGEIMPERKSRKAALEAGVLDGNRRVSFARGPRVNTQSMIIELDDDEDGPLGELRSAGSAIKEEDMNSVERGRRLSVQFQGGGSHANLN